MDKSTGSRVADLTNEEQTIILDKYEELKDISPENSGLNLKFPLQPQILLRSTGLWALFFVCEAS